MEMERRSQNQGRSGGRQYSSGSRQAERYGVDIDWAREQIKSIQSLLEVSIKMLEETLTRLEARSPSSASSGSLQRSRAQQARGSAQTVKGKASSTSSRRSRSLDILVKQVFTYLSDIKSKYKDRILEILKDSGEAVVFSVKKDSGEEDKLIVSKRHLNMLVSILNKGDKPEGRMDDLYVELLRHGLIVKGDDGKYVLQGAEGEKAQAQQV